jgi:hypothetical protein
LLKVSANSKDRAREARPRAVVSLIVRPIPARSSRDLSRAGILGTGRML